MADSEVTKPWELYKQYSDDELDAMSLGEVASIRGRLSPDDVEAQNRISKFEHQAYAREAVKENPALALAYPAFPPVYAAGKAVGLIGGRSQPSIEQAAYGVRGVIQGLSEVIGESKPWLLYKKAINGTPEEVKPWEMFKGEKGG